MIPAVDHTSHMWRIWKLVQRWIGFPALSFLLPSSCFCCGQALGRFQYHGSCLACWTGFSLPERLCCPGCALPRPSGTDLLGPARGRCPSCLLTPPAVDTVLAALNYDPNARAFLLRAKLGRHVELFRPLGRQLASRIDRCSHLRNCTAVIAAPSHPWMTLRRGFRPATEIARVATNHLGLPLLRGVLRTRLSGRLASKQLSAGQRRRATLAAIRSIRRVPGERILLIDDVMTSGSTVEACSRVLKQAGAVEVHAAIWARVI